MLISQPLSYAAEFWRAYRQNCHTLFSRLFSLHQSPITTIVHCAILVRHLVLSTLFLDNTPPYSPYLERHADAREDIHAKLNELSHFGPMEVDNAVERPERSRKQRPTSIAIDTVLTMNGTTRRPPPAEHLPGSPSGKKSFESSQMLPPASPIRSPTRSAHLRSQSVVDSPRRMNRLSMSFPVLPPTAGSSRPTSWANSPITSPTEQSSSGESANFLTQLASQERKVLELKDALRHAEVDLDRLKRQWGSHEALKKRADVRRVQALQPLSANLSSLETSEDDVDGSSQWLHKEMERRKALLSGIKTSNRKVFSGSKHTRTLSLLSPEKTKFSQPFPQPSDARNSEDNPYRSPTHNEISRLDAREDTLSQLEGQSKEAILRTGKQMANDIKDGLWTFFEDIRQATIGEEATQAHDNTSTPTVKKPLRRSNTVGSTNGRKAGTRPANNRAESSSSVVSKHDSRHDTLIDIGGSFWREMGVETPVPVSKQAQHKKSQSRRLSTKPVSNTKGTPAKSEANEDSWDSWDTPGKDQQTPLPAARPRRPSADADSDTSSELADSASDGISTPMTDEHSRQTPRTSTSLAGNKRNSIPWPDLEKLTPSSLKRTASTLMKEWERSMTPSPSVEEIEGLAYDGSPGFGSSTMSAKTNKSD